MEKNLYQDPNIEKNLYQDPDKEKPVSGSAVCESGSETLLQKKPSALIRKHPAFHNKTNIYSVIFAHLEPDPVPTDQINGVSLKLRNAE